MLHLAQHVQGFGESEDGNEVEGELSTQDRIESLGRVVLHLVEFQQQLPVHLAKSEMLQTHHYITCLWKVIEPLKHWVVKFKYLTT